MLSQDQKKLLQNTGILFGIFVLVCAILITMMILTKGFWQNGLQKNLQDTLNKNYPSTYKVGDYVELKTGLNTEAAFYRCRNTKTGNSSMFAAIIKIPTISGPVPAVFLINNGEGQFADYAVDNGNVAKVIDPKFTSGTISYWQKQLPAILEKAGSEND